MSSGGVPGVDEAPNHFSVQLHEGDLGWEVRILDPEGSVAWTRSCGNITEASTLASTIRQHIYWLSPDKLREYYKLSGTV